MIRQTTLTAALTLILAPAIAADAPVGLTPTEDDAGAMAAKRGYSPYAGRAFPTQVYWGDTHVHTDNSLDARGLGVKLDVEDALRFARGEEIVSTHGIPFKLSRPLDWIVITDHSDGMGAMKEVIRGNPNLLKDPTVREWHTQINQGGDEAFKSTMDVIIAFTEGRTPEVVLDEAFQQTVWDDYLDTVEAYNDPGDFTTVIGYEWTSTEKGNNLHRNMIYRDGQDRAQMMVPYTTTESFNPEDLWTWMETYEKNTRGRVLALAHTVTSRTASCSRSKPTLPPANRSTGTMPSDVHNGSHSTRPPRSRAMARRIQSSRRTTNSPTTGPGTRAT
jgi:hypothetical protein